MIIKSVKLSNFRSHKLYTLRMGDEITQILGENGWGKTSILEAICIALQGKSFRAVDRDIINRGAEFYRIEIDFLDGRKSVVTYKKSENTKNFQVKDKKLKRLPKKERYPIVLFLPDDLHLIGSSPARKRDFFDKILSQFSDSYSAVLSRYNKVIRQRNELLKQEFVNYDSLFPWDTMLSSYGVEIRDKRKELADRINQELTGVYRGIAKNRDTVEISYKPYIEEVDESDYMKLLALDFERDKITGHTNFGVHKDDFEFIFNGSLADGSASRGEVRSLVVALKFIEAEILYKELRKKPIILLDDIFSELDKTRQEALVENFKRNQIILTSVG